MAKKSLIGVFSIVIIFTFFFGVGVGFYKIPPYAILNEIHDRLSTDKSNAVKYDPDSLYRQVNVTSLIHINNENDVFAERAKLVQYVWKQNNLPYEKMPSNIDNNINDNRYSNMQNLSRIDRITISMEYGVDSYAYLFLANNTNNKLVIYHQGHDGDFVLGKHIIQFFLNKGYSVLAFSMPLVGINNEPIVDLPNFGKLKLMTHDDLQFLESDHFSPIKYFVEPVFVSLNYVDENYNFNSYYMIGISGGGWTTAFYSAIDSRIDKNYPVAGTTPMYLRFNNQKNTGDYEQMLPALYNMTNYLDQYIMASYGQGREQLQIFNKNDPCCFSGTGYSTYESEVQDRLSHLGHGNFSVFLDEDNIQHSISDRSLEVILQNMQK